MTMPTNYERLIANKKSTIENVNTYVSGSEQIDAQARDKELVTQITEKPVLLGADLILNLEELRDLALGITWKQYEKTDGSFDLIRDCTNQDTEDINTETAQQISFTIQSVNLLIGAQKVLEIEGKDQNDKISALLTAQLDKITSGNSIDIKEFNAEVLQLLEDAGISGAKAKLTSAKDFISMDNRQFHVSTLTKQKDGAGEDKLVVESDNMLLGLTDIQKEQYNKIHNSAPGQVLEIDWYDNLSAFDKALVKNYAEKIASGNVMLPTQTREKLAGLRNAYEKSVFVSGMKGEDMEQVLEVLHTGTPSFHGKGDRLEQTKENLNQLDTFIPDGSEITDNALNSPQIANGIPNFLNKIDRDAPDLIQKAQVANQKVSCAVTPFNAMRRMADNDNHGFDKNLIKLGVALKDKDGFQDISNYLINGVNKDLALQQLKAIDNNPDLKNALKNAIEAKSMIVSTHSILDSENQNLKLVSSMIAVDFACNNEKGAVKTLIPDINIGKVNIHCASGKDRTGISLTDATNKAVSEKLGLSEQQAKENLKTQIKGGHTQELASLNGGTPGCHGVKSDSKTALSKGNMLSELIENTASFNKIKTPKSTGEKAKNLFTNIAIALVAVITLPITLIGAVAYSAYFGVQRLTAYTPDKDTIEKANSSTQGTVKSEEELDKTIKKDQTVILSNEKKPILGYHTKTEIEKEERQRLIDPGVGGKGA
jgi:hypothetical protein